ncbi:MAG: hypothetical protein K2P37_00650 [Oscillospiraceae bacterium]|nr:hypothetical protein [Oscillospiraceae bacterium]
MERLTKRYTNATLGAFMVCAANCISEDFDCNNCSKLDEIVARLAAYEDTEMMPEDIDALQNREEGLAELLVNISCGCAVSYGRLEELSKAEKDGRLVVLPDTKYTDADGEEALRKAMWTCGNTNNPVTRYAADAIAEKLCREAKDENPSLTLEELREMDGEPVWIEWGGHPQAGWALVRVWSKASNTIYLTYHNGNTDLLNFVLNDGGKIYHRRPEVG